jgi:hypothetical protein
MLFVAASPPFFLHRAAERTIHLSQSISGHLFFFFEYAQRCARK